MKQSNESCYSDEKFIKRRKTKMKVEEKTRVESSPKPLQYRADSSGSRKGGDVYVRLGPPRKKADTALVPFADLSSILFDFSIPPTQRRGRRIVSFGARRSTRRSNLALRSIPV